MFTYAIRISHDVAQAYQDAMAMTFKDFQENGQFTDLDLYCHGGRRVSVHRTILLKFSPRLSELLGRQTCCFCHGVECDGKPDPFAISLPDFDVSTVFSLLDVLYRGRAYFATRQEYEDVMELNQALGLNLTPSALSLEVNGPDGTTVEIDPDSALTSFLRKNLKRAEQLPEQDFILSAREAKKKRVENEDDEETESELEEDRGIPQLKDQRSAPSQAKNRRTSHRVESGEKSEDSLDDPNAILDNEGRRMCSKCQKWYNAKIWFTRHYKSCTAVPPQTTNGENTSKPQTQVQDSDDDTRSCPYCQTSLKTRGGWHTRHIKTCKFKEDPMETQASESAPVIKSPSVLRHLSTESMTVDNEMSKIALMPEVDDQDRLICRNCGQYFRRIGGWHTKHVLYCIGENKKNSQVFEKSELTCPKCGKEYSPHCRRFVESHVEKCDGTLQVIPNANSSNVNKTAPTSPAAKLSSPAHTSKNEPSLNCKFCHGSFTVGDFKHHLATCVQHQQQLLLQQQQQQQQQSVDGKSEDQSFNPKTPLMPIIQAREMYDRGEFTCYICDHKYAKREIFKNHLVSHFRSNLQPLKPEVIQSLACDLCDYVGKDKNSMYVHIGLRHRLLRQFVPDLLNDVLFKQMPLPSISSSGSKTAWTCPVCQAEFITKNPIRGHMVKHFRAEIKERFLNKEDPTKCLDCPHTSDNSDHMIVHLAWTHQKLREFLPPAEGEHLFSSSGIGRRTDATTDASAAPASADTTADTIASEENLVTDPSFDQSSKPNFDCYVCQKNHKKRSELKQHIFTHFRTQIQDKYFGQASAKVCPFCNYKSNSPEHVLIHVGLTHQKICEYMQEDATELVFGEKRKENVEMALEEVTSTKDKKGNKKDNKDGSCFKCGEIFESKDQLKTHQETCIWNCPQCSKPFVNSGAIKKHNEVCPASGSNKSVFSCHICETEYESSHHLNAHYSFHYKEDLKAKIANDNTGFTGVFNCTLCDHRAMTPDALASHNGTKHALFVEFMPQEIAEKFREFSREKAVSKKGRSAGEADSDDAPPAAAARNGDEIFSCSTCFATFESHLHLTHHMTNVNCKPPGRKSSRQNSDGPVRCKICQDEVGSFLQYKCHLLVHFETLLNRDWALRYEADSGKCLECGGSDNIVPGAEMGEEGKSSFVRHMALDHDKIFDYLDRDIRRHMRMAFDDGSIALPPTPPPPQTPTEEQKTTSDACIEDDNNIDNEDMNEEIHIQIEAVEDVINPEIIEPEDEQMEQGEETSS